MTPAPCECQHYDPDERYCAAIDSWEICCAGCPSFAPRHIAPPEPPERDHGDDERRGAQGK